MAWTDWRTVARVSAGLLPITGLSMVILWRIAQKFTLRGHNRRGNGQPRCPDQRVEPDDDAGTDVHHHQAAGGSLARLFPSGDDRLCMMSQPLTRSIEHLTQDRLVEGRADHWSVVGGHARLFRAPVHTIGRRAQFHQRPGYFEVVVRQQPTAARPAYDPVKPLARHGRCEKPLAVLREGRVNRRRLIVRLAAKH